MAHLWFKRSVGIVRQRPHPPGVFAVQRVQRAAHMLLYEWPAEPGPKHREARKTLLDCLEGRCDPEKARDAFELAALEAGILAPPGDWDRHTYLENRKR